jgi:hypothetical protein
MSGAAPLIIIMLLVGGIALWGFLTDWTFSGLLPREGARCTPGEDSKDENAEEYIYDADKECLIVNKCKEGWEPNYSNTACISTSSGDTCTVSNPDPNGVYRYDTSGTCALDCNTGYQESGGVCVSACNSTTTEYDPMKVGKCLSDDNKKLVTCPYKDEDTSTNAYKNNMQDITFKNDCGPKDLVRNDIDMGIVGCNEPENLQSFCNDIPGCIGFRRFGNGCSRLILDTPGACEHYSDQMYVENPGAGLDTSGKLANGPGVIYLNTLCHNKPNATYETWVDSNNNIFEGDSSCATADAHMSVCSDNPECVGFHMNSEGCAELLRKKTT